MSHVWSIPLEAPVTIPNFPANTLLAMLSIYRSEVFLDSVLFVKVDVASL